MTGQISTDLPQGHEPHIMIKVEGSQRWFLGPTVVGDSAGHWLVHLNIGNPVPQSRDRHFLICVYTLPSSSLAELSELLNSRIGEGVVIEELPRDRKDLGCVGAVRRANT